MLSMLVIMASYAKKRRCWVKQKTLAEIFGISRQAVQQRQRGLVTAGYLKVTPQFWASGSQRENAYELVFEGQALELAPPASSGACAIGTEKENREKSPALLGPVEEKMRSESDACNDGLVIDVRDPRPTRPKAKSPEKLNPVTLAEYTVHKFRRLQWGTPGAVTAKELGGHYRRWHHDEGVCYREIKIAVDLFCEEWPEIDVPAGRLFIKQRFDWITKAKEFIYQQDLPKKQAANRAMWDQIQADLDNWLAENPGATKEQEDAMTAALWQTWKQDPRYAISYT
jgi:hypothetical protein